MIKFLNQIVASINKISPDVMEKAEWLTLNIATGMLFVLDNYFGTLITAIGVISLAFFNIMRGIKIWKEIKTKNNGKNKTNI